MGLPITHYDHLADLAEGKADAKRMFSQYRLFVVIVADPSESSGFTKALEQQFLDLDRNTGRHLAFFAPIPEPQLWSSDPMVQARPWRARRKETGEPLGEMEKPFSKNPSETMRAMRVLLDLPEDERPYLFITPDLASSGGVWLETSAERIGPQLELLGAWATRAGSGVRAVSLTEAVLEVAEGTGAMAGQCTRRALWSPATSLALIGVSSVNPGRSADRLRQFAEGKAEEICSAIRRAGENTTPEPPADDEEVRSSMASRNLAACAAVVATLAGRDQRWSPWPGLKHPVVRRLEPAARYRLEWGYIVLSEISKVPQGGDALAWTVVVSWGTALETELNASLGHSLRATVGVDLPRYFGLKQPGLRGAAIAIGNGKMVPLNEGVRGALRGVSRIPWRAPTLGELRLAVEGALGQGGPAVEGGALGKFGRIGGLPHFFSRWQTVSQSRNDAAHGRDVGREQLNAVRGAMEALLESRAMDLAIDLKSQLRGESCELSDEA